MFFFLKKLLLIGLYVSFGWLVLCTWKTFVFGAEFDMDSVWSVTFCFLFFCMFSGAVTVTKRFVEESKEEEKIVKKSMFNERLKAVENDRRMAAEKTRNQNQ